MKKLMLAASVCAVLGLASPAYAASFVLADFTIDDFDETSSDEALDIQTSKLLDPNFAFSLNVGQSTSWIDLFSIATDEGSINDDDESARPISVSFNFSTPSFGGTETGETVGDSILWGLIGWGEVDWGAPAVLPFGSTGLLRITLENTTFGLNSVPGDKDAGTVRAKFKLLQDDTPAPVPEPGTLALLGGGLAAAAARLRRRRTQQS